MAEVYKRIRGEPIERVVARTKESYYGTDKAARLLYSHAKTILAEHRAYGGSEIDFDDSDFLTWTVGLTDKDTHHDSAHKVNSGKDFEGPIAIEFGHRNNSPRYGEIGRWVEGPSPLRQALDDLGWGKDFGKRATGRGKRG